MIWKFFEELTGLIRVKINEVDEDFRQIPLKNKRMLVLSVASTLVFQIVRQAISV